MRSHSARVDRSAMLVHRSGKENVLGGGCARTILPFAVIVSSLRSTESWFQNSWWEGAHPFARFEERGASTREVNADGVLQHHARPLCILRPHYLAVAQADRRALRLRRNGQASQGRPAVAQQSQESVLRSCAARAQCSARLARGRCCPINRGRPSASTILAARPLTEGRIRIRPSALAAWAGALRRGGHQVAVQATAPASFGAHAARAPPLYASGSHLESEALRVAAERG